MKLLQGFIARNSSGAKCNIKDRETAAHYFAAAVFHSIFSFRSKKMEFSMKQ